MVYPEAQNWPKTSIIYRIVIGVKIRQNITDINILKNHPLTTATDPAAKLVYLLPCK